MFDMIEYLPEIICNYRHYSSYAVNAGTHKKTAESENRVNQGYLVVLKGRKIEYNYKPH